MVKEKFFVVATLAVLVGFLDAAAIIPIDSTYVKSDRVGNDFSYSIQENKGVAAVLEPVPQQHLTVPASHIVQPIAQKSVLSPLTSILQKSVIPSLTPINYYHGATHYALAYPYLYHPIAYNIINA